MARDNGAKGIPLVLGIQTAPAIALPMVAYDLGFFKEEGLDVKLQEFTAGKFALQALIGGSIDVVTPAEVPPTLALMQGNAGSFIIVAQGVEKTINEVRVVARIDNGLSSPHEYFTAKKRKLATSFGGGPEFFTHQFLKKFDISLDDVELISQKPEDMPAALSSGSVDAVAIFEPFAYFAEQKAGGTVTFSDDALYSELYVYVVSEDFIRKSPPDTIDRLLRALVKAELFTRQHPAEAKQIVIAHTKLDKEVLDAIWDSFDFKITINPRLLEYMSAEARWAVETGKVPPDARLPPFQEFINDSYLRRVRPESVLIP